MNWVKSLIIAFSMYSKIPMPHLNLEEKDMRYVMGFFPLVGLVLGACQFIWYKLSAILGVPNVSRALIFLVLPVIVTGGIHVDGYMDTSDAIHSYGDREKKLSILKDSHIGAFAVIRLLVYSAVYFAALFWMAEQGKEQAFLLFAGIFYLSRILSGFAAVNFRGARKNGMLYTFTSVTDRYRVNALLGIQFVICLVGMGLVDIYKTGAVFLAAGLVLCYYRHMAYKEFGGVTGDLAGYFLCVSELCMTVVLACVNIL
jgi:adenosylcobinamide-GDP ribazoletransferase